MEDDLLRGVLELLASQPQRRCGSVQWPPPVDPAVPEQEGQQLLAFAPQIVRRRLTRPHKIAHRFMVRIRRRCSRASVTASRRFVLMRSPERFGIKAGATTMHSWPSALTWR